MLLVIPSIASAVTNRENEQGQMLVTQLNITQYDDQGNLNPDFRSEYEFTYDDDNDDLIKVVWTRWIEGTVYKEVLQREGNELKFSYYIDDELQTNQTREYKFDANNSLIKLCKITREYDSRIGLNKYITILEYSTFRGGKNRKIMRLHADMTVYNFTRDIRYGDSENFYRELPQTPGVWKFCFDHSNRELGFKDDFDYLISDDNLMYRVYDFKEERYYLLNGNLVELCTDDLAKLTTKKDAVRQEYSDIENPTNINILPLVYQNYNSYEPCLDKYIETVTPWYPLKSKFLPLKINEIEPITFDYEINWRGHLEQMTISSYRGMPYSTVIDFEYESDISGFGPF